MRRCPCCERPVGARFCCSPAIARCATRRSPVAAAAADLAVSGAGSGRRAARVAADEFRECGNAVLLGTSSFWEGVDVKGAALSVVIIDKLPFAAPDDPVLKARLDAIERRGGNPFFEEQIPQAVITLKQGVGRLMRDPNDFGVVMLCDQRLRTRATAGSSSRVCRRCRARSGLTGRTVPARELAAVGHRRAAGAARAAP